LISNKLSPEFWIVYGGSAIVSRVLGKESPNIWFGDKVQINGGIVITSVEFNSWNQNIIFGDELAIVRNDCINMLSVFL